MAIFHSLSWRPGAQVAWKPLCRCPPRHRSAARKCHCRSKNMVMSIHTERLRWICMKHIEAPIYYLYMLPSEVYIWFCKRQSTFMVTSLHEKHRNVSELNMHKCHFLCFRWNSLASRNAAPRSWAILHGWRTPMARLIHELRHAQFAQYLSLHWCLFWTRWT